MKVSGEFVSLMICGIDPPFATRLTFFAEKNGFCCLKMADDLRQKDKIGSFLGLAVMLPKPDNEGWF